MRVEFLPSIDFNQMLVYSTFAHLLFLTWVIFFPNYGTQEQIIVPTFRLDLIELPPKAKPVSLPKNKEVVPPVVTKEKAVTKVKPIVKKLKKHQKAVPLKPQRVSATAFTLSFLMAVPLSTIAASRSRGPSTKSSAATR